MHQGQFYYHVGASVNQQQRTLILPYLHAVGYAVATLGCCGLHASFFPKGLAAFALHDL